MNVYANEVSICDGRFETGQLVHVEIDWDTKAVEVNKFRTYIEGSVYYGIVTGSYKNKLDQETFSIIGYFKDRTFIAQNQNLFGQMSPTNFARLNCSKSFSKPFTNRMLDIGKWGQA
jgi:hypothetical protein